MAKVHITLARVNARADTGSTLPIPDAMPIAAETMISAAASAMSTIMSAEFAYSQGAWTISVMGGPIWVAFGSAPAAGEGSGWLLQDGETRSFGASAGQRVAVADAN